MSPAIHLAEWILAHVGAVTHLKLQKLAFYCYGVASALCPAEAQGELGRVPFVAWKHGPVNEDIYRRYTANGAAVLSPRGPAPSYSDRLSNVLEQTLRVYGGLTAWQLREQSHLERPWLETPQSAEISQSAMVQHFDNKYGGREKAIAPPEYHGGQWSRALDGIPARTYLTFDDLAASL